MRITSLPFFAVLPLKLRNLRRSGVLEQTRRRQVTLQRRDASVIEGGLMALGIRRQVGQRELGEFRILERNQRKACIWAPREQARYSVQITQNGSHTEPFGWQIWRDGLSAPIAQAAKNYPTYIEAMVDSVRAAARLDLRLHAAISN